MRHLFTLAIAGVERISSGLAGVGLSGGTAVPISLLLLLF